MNIGRIIGCQLIGYHAASRDSDADTPICDRCGSVYPYQYLVVSDALLDDDEFRWEVEERGASEP